MNDREFVTAAEDCAIPCREFRHADHVRLAWLYLHQYALLDAIGRFTAALRRFATRCGAAGKYYETITWAYPLIIHERMQHVQQLRSLVDKAGKHIALPIRHRGASEFVAIDVG